MQLKISKKEVVEMLFKSIKPFLKIEHNIGYTEKDVMELKKDIIEILLTGFTAKEIQDIVNEIEFLNTY
jgi:hypothetical protein